MRLSLGLAGALALGAPGWTSVAVASPTVHAGQEQPPLRPARQGEVQQYRLAYESSADVDLAVLMQAEAQAGSTTGYRFEVALTGTLSARVLSVTPQGAELFVRVTGRALRIVMNGQDRLADGQGIEAVLQRGILVSVAPDGQVRTVRVGVDASDYAAQFVRSLAAMLQFVRPPGPALAGTWTAEERDPVGAYEARYAADPARDGEIGVRKTKLRYLASAAPGAPSSIPGRREMERVVTPEATTWSHFDAGTGRLTLLDAEEALTTAVDGKKIASAKSRLQLIARPVAAARKLLPGDRLALAALRSAPALPLFERADPRAVEAAIQRTALGDATPRQLLERLANAGSDAAELDALYLKLKALAYLHPESGPALAEALGSADPGGSSFELLTRVLSAVGDEAAQSALATAIRKRAGDPVALAALAPALAGAPAPTMEAETVLREQLASADPAIVSVAMLALGGVAHGLADAQPDRARAIVATLAARLGQASTGTDKAAALQALGNAATPDIADAVLSYLADPAPEVRIAALDALRGLASAEVEARLLAVLTGDQDARVRYEAAFVLGFGDRGAAAIHAQIAAFAVEPDGSVRAAMLSNLARSAASGPAAAVIRDAAARDKSEHVRLRAAELMREFPAITPGP